MKKLLTILLITCFFSLIFNICMIDKYNTAMKKIEVAELQEGTNKYLSISAFLDKGKMAGNIAYYINEWNEGKMSNGEFWGFCRGLNAVDNYKIKSTLWEIHVERYENHELLNELFLHIESVCELTTNRDIIFSLTHEERVILGELFEQLSSMLNPNKAYIAQRFYHDKDYTSQDAMLEIQQVEKVLFQIDTLMIKNMN